MFPFLLSFIGEKTPKKGGCPNAYAPGIQSEKVI
jgi:hypothetical protein